MREKAQQLTFKLAKFLSKFGVDKWLHFVVGYCIAFLGGLLNPIAGLAIAIIVGIIKEIADHQTEGNKFDWQDLIFTVIGGVFGFLFIIISKH